ncbi:MAG: 5'-methylthioadenosine/adenosylhomocysteine nucleosidase [Eubacteriales bacterium]
MLGIIGAMQIEVDSLLSAMEDRLDSSVAGTVFSKGKIGGQEVVVVMCGIGKVCAALITQILIDRFQVHAIVNTGVAGGLDERLEVGDLVIATDAVQHDFDLTGFGYVRGHLPCAGGEKTAVSRFPADKNLINRFESAAEKVGGEGKTILGTVVSGDIFVCDPALKERLIREFGAAAAEMEGAAIAQVCYLNKVPFAIVRAISDLAGKEAKISYDEFERKAALRSAKIIQQMLSDVER